MMPGYDYDVFQAYTCHKHLLLKVALFSANMTLNHWLEIVIVLVFAKFYNILHPVITS